PLLRKSPPPPSSTLFPYTTLFRSFVNIAFEHPGSSEVRLFQRGIAGAARHREIEIRAPHSNLMVDFHTPGQLNQPGFRKLLARGDRKSTRLNSSHVSISYAVFCLK